MSASVAQTTMSIADDDDDDGNDDVDKKRCFYDDMKMLSLILVLIFCCCEISFKIQINFFSFSDDAGMKFCIFVTKEDVGGGNVQDWLKIDSQSLPFLINLGCLVAGEDGS